MKKGIVILIFLASLIVFLAAAIFYYFLGSQSNAYKDEAAQKESRDVDPELKMQKDFAQQNYNVQFPDVVDGIINIVSDKKTTIKTKDNVQYLISPSRPKSFFSDSGIKNGANVEIRGKILTNNTLTLGSVINK